MVDLDSGSQREIAFAQTYLPSNEGWAAVMPP